MRASDTNTSEKCWSRFICTSGRTSTPGACMSMANIVSPACLGTSGSVRARQRPQRAHMPRLVQTFWPEKTHSSPSRSARVPTLARSEPASGSENIWHQISEPSAIERSQRSCCSVLPWVCRHGPTMPSPTA